MKLTETAFLYSILFLTGAVFFLDAIYNLIQESSDLPNDKIVEALIVFVTNLTAVPPLIGIIRKGAYVEGIIGFMSLVTSIFYHVCDSTGIEVWNMNAGNWHRLDNVFVILVAQEIAYFLTFALKIEHTATRSLPLDTPSHSNYQQHFAHEQRVVVLFRWLGLTFCLVCQERAPWNVVFTILPIIITGFLAFLRMKLFVRYDLRPEFDPRSIKIGLVFAFIAIFFFVLGLDDKHDYLRAKHGVWHAMLGFALYFLFNSREITSKKLID
ncbi:hypothetical protein AKO1_007410 [Acrasis kona]|uniref:Uncharacterized protein n=1 Tax=Acrasis kona TaxID=1008807 RepID=A0AAW2YRU4_9EUKA